MSNGNRIGSNSSTNGQGVSSGNFRPIDLRHEALGGITFRRFPIIYVPSYTIPPEIRVAKIDVDGTTANTERHHRALVRAVTQSVFGATFEQKEFNTIFKSGFGLPTRYTLEEVALILAARYRNSAGDTLCGTTDVMDGIENLASFSPNIVRAVATITRKVQQNGLERSRIHEKLAEYEIRHRDSLATRINAAEITDEMVDKIEKALTMLGNVMLNVRRDLVKLHVANSDVAYESHAVHGQMRHLRINWDKVRAGDYSDEQVAVLKILESGGLSTMPHIVELLSRMRDRDMYLAYVSNSDRAFVEPYVTALDLLHLSIHEGMVCAGEAVSPKPHPAPFVRSLAGINNAVRAQYEPRQCLSLGNGSSDAIAGVLFRVGVSIVTGSHPDSINGRRQFTSGPLIAKVHEKLDSASKATGLDINPTDLNASPVVIVPSFKHVAV